MIAELDRYQGIVLRQILVTGSKSMRLGVADVGGRIDAYHVNDAAFQVKYSSKRLSPWQFTYMPDNLEELSELTKRYRPVWAILVCGQDGTVALSLDELQEIIKAGKGGAAWIRVRRCRNGMYRVTGAAGELARAKPKGVELFLAEIPESNEWHDV